MGWGLGASWYKDKAWGDLTVEGAGRTGSCGKEDHRGKVGAGPRRGRTGTMGGGERSEAWARGPGKAGVNLPVKASPEAPAWTNGPRALVPSGAAAAPPVSQLLSAPLLLGPAAGAARRFLPPPAWAPGRAACSGQVAAAGPSPLAAPAAAAECDSPGRVPAPAPAFPAPSPRPLLLPLRAPPSGAYCPPTPRPGSSQVSHPPTDNSGLFTRSPGAGEVPRRPSLEGPARPPRSWATVRPALPLTHSHEPRVSLLLPAYLPLFFGSPLLIPEFLKHCSLQEAVRNPQIFSTLTSPPPSKPFHLPSTYHPSHYQEPLTPSLGRDAC